MMDILPSLGVAVVMAIPVLFMNDIPLTSYFIFPLQLVTGAAVWLLVSERIHLPEYVELMTIAKQYIFGSKFNNK